jgi:hypothetical protein
MTRVRIASQHEAKGLNLEEKKVNLPRNESESNEIIEYVHLLRHQETKHAVNPQVASTVNKRED